MDKRTRLLDVAEARFAARGYDAVGVQEIVAAAGVTKPTLYHYFGNKLGILEAVLARRWQPFLQEVTATAYRGDLSLALTGILDAYLAFARREPEAYRLWLSLFFSAPEHEVQALASRFGAQQSAFLTDLFRQAAAHHGNMRGREVRYAHTFLGFLNNLALWELSGAAVLDEAAKAALLHQFSYGIYS